MTGTDADGSDSGVAADVAGETGDRSIPRYPDSDGSPDPSPDVDAGTDAGTDPEAFQALGNETRLTVLQHLLEREDDGHRVVAFSDLQAATDADSSAGFAYHLRQLTGRYVRKVDPDTESDGGDPEEGYVLTYAGRKVARAVAAGTYSDSVDLDPVGLADPCPHCGADSLVARCADNVVGVACEDCGRPVLSLPFPPQGYRDRPPEAIPRAFDRYHHHRLSSLREGVCPECAGRVGATVDVVPGSGSVSTDAEDAAPARSQVAFECEACGHGSRTPVALSLLYHPAVVAFYHDHGVDVRERPLWNVGSEWREATLSADPQAVVVSTRLDDELLELFVDGSAAVVDHRRRPADE